jgi:hypothetical protein
LRNEKDIAPSEADGSFEYFIGTKPARLEALAALVGKFDMAPPFDGSDLHQMSDWFDRYGPFPVPFLRNKYFPRNPLRSLPLPDKSAKRQIIRAFESYDPRWSGDYVGTNALFDFGAYVGDCFIFRDPELHWGISDKNCKSVHHRGTRSTEASCDNETRNVRDLAFWSIMLAIFSLGSSLRQRSEFLSSRDGFCRTLILSRPRVYIRAPNGPRNGIWRLSES